MLAKLELHPCHQCASVIISLMKFVDVSYYYNDTSDAGCLLNAHAANLGYLEFLPANWEVSLVKFLNAEGYVQHGRTRFHFFKGSAWLLFFNKTKV